MAALAVEQNELVKVRMEYRERIERLEARLDAKDGEIRVLTERLSQAGVTIAQQTARIQSLEEDIAELHKERAHEA